METLIKKICIIEGSSAQGSVDLDSLTNFPQVIMPHKFKAPEFIKYNGTGDPCTHLHMFCRKMAPNGTFKEFQRVLIGNICCNLFSCKKVLSFQNMNYMKMNHLEKVIDLQFLVFMLTRIPIKLIVIPN